MINIEDETNFVPLPQGPIQNMFQETGVFERETQLHENPNIPSDMINGFDNNFNDDLYFLENLLEQTPTNNISDVQATIPLHKAATQNDNTMKLPQEIVDELQLLAFREDSHKNITKYRKKAADLLMNYITNNELLRSHCNHNNRQAGLKDIFAANKLDPSAIKNTTSFDCISDLSKLINRSN
ncbi:hypothetical protein BDC45DRAFT_576859 [Circinella umbellata]|nr:hypothetical protein BDC45DRAFT_576859 [Circinella umbellata]